ncbi:DUF3579 domain-containing protein [Gallionella capsiferriformans]|jgi:hypothetical protein|uniref:Uncharacterized protein n=1 Tax=Gallionella capsiferriformans (strain ES-2) TaxID=395494 RepID=D9SHJ7_GALCS|nr:DUF3579 domain-containing protein [Gallionella capsiferriformans]ADL55994.1 Protein of unknown function DUF3579 [Gallionella capsiferriformans ES-2]
MIRNLNEWVILGITSEGEVFAYPDWAERLCGMLAQQSDSNRISHSDYLHPMNIDGLPAVVMDARLQLADIEAYTAVCQFAKDNNLKVRSGRTPDQLSETAKHPALSADRRDLCAIRGA